MEHLSEPFHLFLCETLFVFPDKGAEAVLVQVDIPVIFLREREPPFALVVRGGILLHVALLFKRMDLICRVGAGYTEKIRKFADCRLVQRMDYLNGKDLHGGQAALPLSYDAEDAFVKMQAQEIGDLQ